MHFKIFQKFKAFHQISFVDLCLDLEIIVHNLTWIQNDCCLPIVGYFLKIDWLSNQGGFMTKILYTTQVRILHMYAVNLHAGITLGSP